MNRALSPWRRSDPDPADDNRKDQGKPTFARPLRTFAPAADYDVWEETADKWSYERGQQWAQVAARNFSLKVNGRVTTEALRLFRMYSDEIL